MFPRSDEAAFSKVPNRRALRAVRHNDPRASAQLTMATRASSRARRLLGALAAAHASVPQVRARLSRRRRPEISRAPQRPDEFFRMDRDVARSLVPPRLPHLKSTRVLVSHPPTHHADLDRRAPRRDRRPSRAPRRQVRHARHLLQRPLLSARARGSVRFRGFAVSREPKKTLSLVAVPVRSVRGDVPSRDVTSDARDDPFRRTHEPLLRPKHTETAPPACLRSRSTGSPPRERRLRSPPCPRLRAGDPGDSAPPRRLPRTSWRFPRWATPSRRDPLLPC